MTLSHDPELLSVFAMLHRKAEELLVAHGIYDINNYGWLDHDTPDPDFVGHAMWQMQPPFEPDWGAFLNGATATYFPTDKDEALVVSGEDFIGTMAFARKSFGLALCYSEGADTNILAGEKMEWYWQEYAASLHWLNVASDRIRDYFVMAQFGISVRDYHKHYRVRSGNKKPTYSLPFQEAAKTKSGSNVKSLGELAGIAGRVQQHRTDRNAIVHRIASLTAKQSMKLLYQQRELVQASLNPGVSTATSPKFESTAELIKSSIMQCKQWYADLARASSLVFEIEYFNRTRNHKRQSSSNEQKQSIGRDGQI
jgi:hypothetical protein